MAAFQTVSKRYGQRQANPGAAALEVATVAASPVLRRSFRDEITAVSSLKARETGFVSPKLPGKVETVSVDLGSRVAAGEAVSGSTVRRSNSAFSKHGRPIPGAEAAAAQAKAALEQAEKEYRRASNLLAERVIPQSRFDAAEAGYEGAREAVAAAEEQSKQAKAALETAEEHLKDAEIGSPLSGVVVERNVEVGQSVAPGMVLLRILDQSSLKAEFELPEADFGRVAVGMPVMVAVDSLADRQFPGRVSVVNRVMDSQTRTFRVRAEILYPGGKLAEGMFARVRILTGKRPALAIPRDALQRLPGSGTVYVFVVEGNKAEKRTVKVGAAEDEWAEVLEGLREGELVVISGAGRLPLGTLVKVAAAVTDTKPQVEGVR